MKVVTLMENTTEAEGIHAAHGLSNYIETDKHKILFDMGPDYHFLLNAEKLGVDISKVDIAVLSHGHYDHGGGLMAFMAANTEAPVFVRENAFGDYYSTLGGVHSIGLNTELKEYTERLVWTEEECTIDDELSLFSGVEDHMDALKASAKLKEKTESGEWIPDTFTHEQDLLVREGDKAVLFAGCAHMGIVNILEAAREKLGRLPDAVFGGFHFFQLDPEDPASAELVDSVGRKLLEGDTVYYTGHCTGEFAYGRLKAILGERLQPMTGGSVEIL